MRAPVTLVRSACPAVKRRSYDVSSDSRPLAWASALLPGAVLLRREDGQPLTLAVATRDAEYSLKVAPVAEAAR